MTRSAAVPLALCCTLIVQLGGCGSGRELPSTQKLPALYTYLEDVQPVFARKCIACHGDEQAENHYRMNTWSGLVAPGSYLQSNVIPGSPTSPMLRTLQTSHRSYVTTEEMNMLQHWVVTDELAYSRSSYHPRDWVYPKNRSSLDFHGGALRANRWDLTSCQQCHGADLGESTQTGCYACHRTGPMRGCTTCHGALVRGGLSLSSDLPPGTSIVHQLHSSPQVTDPLMCSECHNVPTDVMQDGHLFDDPVTRSTDHRAEVHFGPRASMGGVTPSYDPATGTCVVYCHGATLGIQPPTPNTQAPKYRCLMCHDIEKHGKGNDCSVCHQQTLDPCTPGTAGCSLVSDSVGVKFAAKSLHLDGDTPPVAADPDGTCWSCHGSEQTRGAPGPDLRGSTSTLDVTVGLHQIHVVDGPIRDGLPCSTCHPPVRNVNDPGHLDNTPHAEVQFNALANGTLRSGPHAPTPIWDREKGTCTNVYCHVRAKGSVGEVWPWTERVGLHCQSCHKGKESYTIKYCLICHLIAFRDYEINPSTHLNGRMDWSW